MRPPPLVSSSYVLGVLSPNYSPTAASASYASGYSSFPPASSSASYSPTVASPSYAPGVAAPSYTGFPAALSARLPHGKAPVYYDNQPLRHTSNIIFAPPPVKIPRNCVKPLNTEPFPNTKWTSVIRNPLNWKHVVCSRIFFLTTGVDCTVRVTFKIKETIK